MLLEISISTNKVNIDSIIRRIYKVKDEKQCSSNIIYTIIWQCPARKHSERWVSDNIRIMSFNEKGLSRSRNRALEVAIGDILLFSDDDILFENKIYEKILKAYRELPDADIITFKAYTEGKRPFKRYHNKYFRHNILSIMHVSSLEISCKPKKIKKTGLKFNELFGLGSVFPSSEENLFLWDAIKKGLNVYFYPEFIVTHPNPRTSGYNFSPHILKAKGAFFYKIFGKLSYMVIPMFGIKKINLQPNVLKSIFWMYKGVQEYKNYKRRML